MNRTLPLLGLLLLLTGCPDTAKTAKTAAPAPDAAQRARAKTIAQALGKGLKKRLKQALDKDGPPGGIKVCKTAAPEIASVVAAAQKVRVGRTSFKLRNPKNTPPAWAKAWVDQRVATPQFSTAEDGTFRALLPIKLEALCVTCHGAKEKLPEAVRTTLAAEYPDDQATGFAEGDLRGWFWVEIPASP